MKWLFVDTSAIFAILDADDQHHAAVKAVWIELLQKLEKLSNWLWKKCPHRPHPLPKRRQKSRL